jgi:hypothetical protein
MRKANNTYLPIFHNTDGHFSNITDLPFRMDQSPKAFRP